MLANKGEKRVYQIPTDTHAQVLACGSASGEVDNPLIIFLRQRFNYERLNGFS